MLNGFGFRTGEAVRWQLYMTTRFSFREQSAYRTADENFNGQVIGTRIHKAALSTGNSRHIARARV